MSTKRNRDKNSSNNLPPDKPVAGHTSLSEPNLSWPVWTGGEGYWAIEEDPECPHIHVLKNSSKQYGNFKNKLKEGKCNKENFPLLEVSSFWRSLSESKEVYIIDNYFLSNCLDIIMVHQLGRVWQASNLIPQKLHLFSKCAKPNDKSRKMMTLLKEEYQVEKCQIYCYDFANEILHDRITLLDSGLWFGGASTGGFYGGLHVLTGPWPDKKDRFKSLCEALIQKDLEKKAMQ